jgi:Na+/melibiose symporter-like transporter
MTKANYRSKINKIYVPEAAASVGCVATALYIVANLQKFGNWYLLACGIVSALMLCVMPCISIAGIIKMQRVNIPGNSLRQSLTAYSKARIRFVAGQKLNLYFGAVLMLTILPVMVALIDERDFFKENWLWIWYAIAFPFFYAAARWVFKKYIKITEDAENILRQLGA